MIDPLICLQAGACSLIHANVPAVGSVVALLLSVLLLACSGFASASEIAFFSLSPADRKAVDDGEHPNDGIIRSLLDNSDRLLATILISNNLVNNAIVLLCNMALLQIFDFGAPWLEFLVFTVLLTFVLLLFGEIMPKLYGANRSLKYCRRAAPVISLLMTLFAPLARLLARSSTLTERMAHTDNLSVDDLEQALELTDKRELKDERNILEGIIRFGDETVKEVMTSRLDMMALSVEDDYDEVMRFVRENVYSRIPVYRDTVDNICGILYIKDLLPHLAEPSSFDWVKLMRKPVFVPETKPIDDLLREFQRDKCHIAIVVDEFGGTLGMVTMEDILEEIVGEIDDEHDEVAKNYTRINNNTYLFEAKILLSDFCKVMELDDDAFDSVSGDADSLAGLLLELKGDFPVKGETLTFGNLAFEVTDMDARRIIRVKVVRHSR